MRRKMEHKNIPVNKEKAIQRLGLGQLENFNSHTQFNDKVMASPFLGLSFHYSNLIVSIIDG